MVFGSLDTSNGDFQIYTSPKIMSTGTLPTRSVGLRITGIKEQIRWHKRDDTSEIGWFAGLGIEGLIPALAPGGYAHDYTIELISPGGKSVTKSRLSQAPDGFGTSTTVRIGGMGLSPGRYFAKVSGGNQEDTLTINVPDISEPLPEVKVPRINTRIINKIASSQKKPLMNVKEMRLEEVGDCTLLTVKRKNDTEYSAVLKDPSIRELVISDSAIDKVATLMDKSKRHILNFADDYITEDRKEICFFNDIVTLARSVSSLVKYTEIDYLMKMGDTTELLHNRVVAQLIDYYDHVGCTINPKPTRQKKNGRQHDFNVQALKCEVKTIQRIGDGIVARESVRFTEIYQKKLTSVITNDLEQATEQVEANGMIFIAPWSYKLNGILRQCFKDRLMIFPPFPEPDLTVLVLESNRAFESPYVSFPSKNALSDLISTVNTIQKNGIVGCSFVLIKEGIPIRASTAPYPNSAAGYSFKIWETDPN